MLARRVSAEGRTRAYLNGRSATAADLRDIGGALLSFYGQHEHRKLTLASAQLEILDGFCGPEQAARRAAFAAVYARERALRERARGAARARRRARPRARPARVGARGDRRGGAERGRGGRARRPSASGCATSRGCGSPPRAGSRRWRPRAARAARPRRSPARRARSRRSRGVDAGARRAGRPRWRRSSVEADDLAGELRRYGEGVDAPPGRLDEVEERLALFERLKRKHGGTIAAVLDARRGVPRAARRARRRRGGARGRDGGAGRRCAPSSTSGRRSCARRARRPPRASPSAVVGVLGELAMDGASFEARLTDARRARARAAATTSSS